MKRKATLLLTPLLLFILYVSLSSYSTGITGQSVAGCTCHSPTASANTIVTLTGLPSGGYTNGTVYAITVSVTNNVIVPFSGGFGLRDGFNLSSTAGAFTAIAGTTLNGPIEIRHNTPKAVVAGTASWTFNWTAPASGNANITFNLAGNATNGSGDNIGDSWNQTTVTIIKSGTPLTVSATPSIISCNGGFSTITANGVGGIPPYTYKLNSGAFQSSATFSNNLANTYTITIKDASTATATTVLNITQPALLNVSASASAILCNGGTSTITATASGGTGALQYRRNTGTYQSSNIFTGNLAATYTITARDVNLCTKTTLVTISQPTAMVMGAPSISLPPCNGSTGSLTITASGGTGTKTYSINPLGPQTNTSGSFTGLIGQTYTITATDANACTKTSTVVITQPSPLLLNSLFITPPLCNGGLGSVSVITTGGTGQKTYSISPLGPQTNTNGNFNGLSAQGYTISVSDALGCTATSVFTMTEPNPITVTANHVSTCLGNPITLSGFPAGGIFSVANPYTGPSTTYTYTYTDGNGCTNTSAPANINSVDLVLSTLDQSATEVCIGGSISLSIHPEGENCTPVNTNNSCGGLEFISNVTFGSINNTTVCDAYGYKNYTSITTNVSAGSSYPISLEDGAYFGGDQWGVWIDYNHNGLFTDQGEFTGFPASGTTTTSTIQIPSNAINGTTKMRVRLMWTGTMQPCGVTTWGEIEDYGIVISGGQTSTLAPFTYLWNNNLNSNIISPTNSNTMATSITAAEQYVVTVTSAEGCTKTATAYVSIHQPNLIDSITATPSQVCPGGSTSLKVYPNFSPSTYCTPSVFFIGCNNEEFISNVTFNTINNTTLCDTIGYKDYSSISTNLLAGNTYLIQLEDGHYYYGDQWGVFIDFNHNGVLTDPGEKFTFPAVGPITTHTIHVPASAYNGATKIRVRLDYVSVPNPCNTTTWGEVEDYTVNITGGQASLPAITYLWSNNMNSNLSSTTTDTTTASNINSTETYYVSISDSYACTDLDSLTVQINCGSTLNLTLFLEGFYNGASSMSPALYNQGETLNSSITDSILVELRDSIFPHNVLASTNAILQTNGNAMCTFATAPSIPYYIAVKHRNSIQTWSKNPQPANTTSYNFSTAATQAYGDNMVEVSSGVWAFYSGELNLDDNIDLLDISLLETDINNFAFGYLITDINGDGNVDLLDSPILESNVSNFIFSNHP